MTAFVDSNGVKAIGSWVSSKFQPKGNYLTSHLAIPNVTVNTSGAGNAVTAISASGHTVTVTKGATFLTQHQTIPSINLSGNTNATNQALVAATASGHNITFTKGSFAPLVNNLIPILYIPLGALDRLTQAATQADFITAFNNSQEGDTIQNSGESTITVYYNSGSLTTTTSTGATKIDVAAGEMVRLVGNKKQLVKYTAGTATHASSADSADEARHSNHADYADSATKLLSSVGNTTTPVYFSNGTPVALPYTIAASVPANAKFTEYSLTGDRLTSTTSTKNKGVGFFTLKGSDGSSNRVVITAKGSLSISDIEEGEAGSNNGGFAIVSTATTDSAITSGDSNSAANNATVWGILKQIA